MSKRYTYNNCCLKEYGVPCFPVMGEMHYSRYNEELWEESLRKIKAGGITIVSTYVFWIHHEEEEGVFDFSGCRNLKKYVECCKKVGLLVLLRIGPWVHGECRNGGFPDWVVDLQDQGVKIRTNDERYLFYVKRFWNKIYEQVNGLLEGDGGPIIGIQLENEYWVTDNCKEVAGDAHMRVLMKLAKEIGFEVSLYTATGWGSTAIGDALPVMGGYCEAPWEQQIEELPANCNFVISHIRNDALIGSDYKKEEAMTYDETKFPFLTAELGGGLQVTAHRRPIASGKDVAAMSITKLASGAALLGYYMYHGGSNPKGRFSTLQESRATRYINYNDLPEINYDFNAPIRQYGMISDGYKEIKLLALFLQDFGGELAVMTADIDPENVNPEDLHTLRKSCRHDDVHGFVFFNNYVRRRVMDTHKQVVFRGVTAKEEITFPPVTITNGSYGFFPYNMKLEKAILESALATPFCRLDEKDQVTFVFYGDDNPQYKWKDDIQANILHLTRKQALNAYKIKLDKEYLVINDNFVYEQNGKLIVTGPNKTVIYTYPKLREIPQGFHERKKEGAFSVYERISSPSSVQLSVINKDEKKESTTYEVLISFDEEKNRNDIILWFDYVGYKMDIYDEKNEKINDHFYTGQRVPLSLRYFKYPHKLIIKICALNENDWVYLEKWPEMIDGRACKLCKVTASEEYR